MNRLASNRWFGFIGKVALVAVLPAALWLAADPTQARQGGKQDIKRGVTKQKATALLKAAKANDQKQESQAAKARKAAAAGVDEGLKKERAALQAKLKSQPEFQTLQKELNTILKGGKGKKATPQQHKERTKALTQVFAKHKPLLDKAFQDAQVDEDHIAAVVGKQLGAGVLLRKRLLATFTVAPPAASPVPPAAKTLALRPPYESTDTAESSDLVALSNDATADKDKGVVTLNSGASFAGGGNIRAVVGDFITIPNGFTKLQVTMKLNESHDLLVSAILGYSQASVDALVELTGGPNNQTQSQNTNLSTVVAPLLFAAHDESTSDQLITKTFNVPRTGGEFLVRGGVRGSFISASAGQANLFEFATVKEIDVKVLP
jgi:hypothetical protein